MIDRKDEGSPIGEGLLECADQLLRHWKRVWDGTLSREAFQNGPLAEIMAAFNAHVAKGAGLCMPARKTRYTCYELGQLGNSLVAVRLDRGRRSQLPTTNNAAERASCVTPCAGGR